MRRTMTMVWLVLLLAIAFTGITIGREALYRQGAEFAFAGRYNPNPGNPLPVPPPDNQLPDTPPVSPDPGLPTGGGPITDPGSGIGSSQTGKTVYLTFDDGPSSNTPKVLDVLHSYGVRATFFVNGSDTEFGRAMYRRMASEGHAIGNHTYSHDYALVYSTVEAYLADTRKLDDLLYATVGIRPVILRFPGGSANHSSWLYAGEGFMAELIPQVRAAGLVYFDWNVSAGDAVEGVTPTEKIIDAVLQGVSGKADAIVLFHDSGKQTTSVEALPAIIEGLQQSGYEFAVLTPGSFNKQFR